MSVALPEISPPPLKRRRISASVPTTSKSVPALPTTSHNDPDESSLTSLHIYSWNINGITPFLPPSTHKITDFLAPSSPSTRSRSQAQQTSLRECLCRWSWPQIIALQEVKIALTDTKTLATVRRVVNTPLDSEDDLNSGRHLYDAHFCLPRDKHNATGFGGKVYGVCTLVRRDVQAVSIKRVDWDLEGRLLMCEITEKNLVVMNVYAVNGTTYDYRNSDTGKVVGTRHDRKKAFHTFLAAEVKDYELRGWHVVVAGDLNISRAKIDSFPQLRTGEEHVENRSDFEKKFMVDLGMLDTFRLLHGQAKKYSYRPRNKPWGLGGDRVDMILTTKSLQSKVKQADILDSQEEIGPSDHVPLFVTMELEENRNGDRDS